MSSDGRIFFDTHGEGYRAAPWWHEGSISLGHWGGAVKLTAGEERRMVFPETGRLWDFAKRRRRIGASGDWPILLGITTDLSAIQDAAAVAREIAHGDAVRADAEGEEIAYAIAAVRFACGASDEEAVPQCRTCGSSLGIHTSGVADGTALVLCDQCCVEDLEEHDQEVMQRAAAVSGVSWPTAAAVLRGAKSEGLRALATLFCDTDEKAAARELFHVVSR